MSAPVKPTLKRAFRALVPHPSSQPRNPLGVSLIREYRSTPPHVSKKKYEAISTFIRQRALLEALKAKVLDGKGTSNTALNTAEVTAKIDALTTEKIKSFQELKEVLVQEAEMKKKFEAERQRERERERALAEAAERERQRELEQQEQDRKAQEERERLEREQLDQEILAAQQRNASMNAGPPRPPHTVGQRMTYSISAPQLAAQLPPPSDNYDYDYNSNNRAERPPSPPQPRYPPSYSGGGDYNHTKPWHRDGAPRGSGLGRGRGPPRGRGTHPRGTSHNFPRGRFVARAWKR